MGKLFGNVALFAEVRFGPKSCGRPGSLEPCSGFTQMWTVAGAMCSCFDLGETGLEQVAGKVALMRCEVGHVSLT